MYVVSDNCVLDPKEDSVDSYKVNEGGSEEYDGQETTKTEDDVMVKQKMEEVKKLRITGK